MALYDWNLQEWREKERGHLRVLSRQAGWAAYQGVAWRNTQIREEALRFLAHSLLLAPLRTNPAFVGIVITEFAKGWRQHERADIYNPSEKDPTP